MPASLLINPYLLLKCSLRPVAGSILLEKMCINIFAQWARRVVYDLEMSYRFAHIYP